MGEFSLKEWLIYAIDSIKAGLTNRIENKKYNCIVYRCGKVIRVDIKYFEDTGK